METEETPQAEARSLEAAPVEKSPPAEPSSTEPAPVQETPQAETPSPEAAPAPAPSPTRTEQTEGDRVEGDRDPGDGEEQRDPPQRQPPGWRRRLWQVVVVLFVTFGLGTGLVDRVVDRWGDNTTDALADAVGQPVLDIEQLTSFEHPIYAQAWAFADERLFDTTPVPMADAQAAIERDGVPLREAKLKLSIKAGRSDVLITDMRARVVGRSDPPAGTLIVPPPAGGTPESISVIFVGFDVDGADPRAYDPDEPGAGLFDTTSLRLEADQTMILVVTGTATRCYCQWVIDIQVVTGGKERTVTVPKETSPLEVTAPAPPYAEAYEARDDDLIPVDPAAACVFHCAADTPGEP